MLKSKDIFGKALLDYFKQRDTPEFKNLEEHIITWTNISEEDLLPLSYLFRDYLQMPKIEQQALKLARGKVLDVGCGAGSHSLYLQNKKFKVKAIDISLGAVLTSKKRGIINVEHQDLLEEKKSFDTILLLMNGTGIFQTYNQISIYLSHLKRLLTPNGQILIDSSDIAYMYDDDERQALSRYCYYGELDYYISYKNEIEYPMKWLYLDYDTLSKACQKVGLKCEKVLNGEHFDYLARLIL